ncbi:MAG: cell division protein ZapA [Lachnospiraceae bacterium]|nr:cell division protein ZapA [Lachnospiraceae bacterium]
MSAKNTVEVLIGGKIIHLSGYESEEYLNQVASYLNHKLSELKELSSFNRMPAETRNLLLSLNVSDDYFKAKKQAEAFEEDLQSKDNELYDLKQQIVDLEVQLEAMKKDGRSLR